MATKPKAASKKKQIAKKTSAKKTPAKTAKKPSPARPKSAVKVIKTPVAKSKPLPKPASEQKVPESARAFEKKIDEMAQISASSRISEGKSNKKPKIALAAVIIIILAAIVYILYPGKRTTMVDEQLKPNEPTGTEPEVKVEEQQAEPAVTKSEDLNTYKVKFKDQLTTISKEVYGDHKEWKRIYEANKDKIKNPNLIFPGQELIIPKIEK